MRGGRNPYTLGSSAIALIRLNLMMRAAAVAGILVLILRKVAPFPQCAHEFFRRGILHCQRPSQGASTVAAAHSRVLGNLCQASGLFFDRVTGGHGTIKPAAQLAFTLQVLAVAHGSNSTFLLI
jgi:hypothetical protein